MQPARLRVNRVVSGLMVLMLVSSTLLTIPTRSASADVKRTTMFLSNFNAIPLGPLPPGTAVPTTVGKILPKTAPVAIINSATSGGRALAVADGTGAAALQFRNAPAGLPSDQDDEDDKGDNTYDLLLVAEFTASITDTDGASFGIVNGGSVLELFSFGAGGELKRAGTPLGLTYAISSVVRLEAAVHLTEQTLDLRLISKGKSLAIRGLPARLDAATLSELVFAATAGTGTYTIDNVAVELLDEDDEEPPAVIIIEPPSHTVEFENGVAFIIVLFNLNNSGGSANNVFLTLDLDDFLELGSLDFLDGTGYVVEIKNGKVTIGLGYNNEVAAGGSLKLKLKFKVKGNGDAELKVKLKFKLKYRDSSGDHEGDDIEISPVVPVVVVAPVVFVRLPVERIDVRFKARWERGGGIRIYGLPLTEPILLSSGITVQYFERVRFEYHPRFAGTEYEVLLGLMGVELGFLQPPVAPPTSTTPISQTWYFPQTGHYIAPAFREFWENRGGLYTFGYPIGEAFVDSNGRLVQYFERTRLELHPEFAGSEYAVLLGLLGEELLVKRKGNVKD